MLSLLPRRILLAAPLLLALLTPAPSHATTLISLDVAAALKRSGLLTTETAKKAVNNNKTKQNPDSFCGNELLPPPRSGR